MFAFYWYKSNRLPNTITDWEKQNINDSVPNIRQFIILKTVNDENIRRSDLTID
jgi:hypothetical protein